MMEVEEVVVPRMMVTGEVEVEVDQIQMERWALALADLEEEEEAVLQQYYVPQVEVVAVGDLKVEVVLTGSSVEAAVVQQR